MRKTRVLVVDDEPDVRMLMSTALEDSSFDVVAAKDVPTAKKLLLSEIPDIVVTDLMMPEESGFSLISYLKENPATKNTPIIVTSVMESENEVLQQGATAFLPKPFSADELVDLVSQLAHKEDIPQMMERALESIRARNYKDAEKVLHEILESGEQGTYPAYAAFYLGEITRIQGNKDEAENFYKMAVQQGSDFWRAYNELGNLAQGRNDLHRAIAYWKRSLGINADQQALRDLVDRMQREVVSKNE